jgi:hypothetical protein
MPAFPVVWFVFVLTSARTLLFTKVGETVSISKEKCVYRNKPVVWLMLLRMGAGIVGRQSLGVCGSNQIIIGSKKGEARQTCRQCRCLDIERCRQLHCIITPQPMILR